MYPQVRGTGKETYGVCVCVCVRARACAFATLEPKVVERHISTSSITGKELSLRTISALMSARFVLGTCRVYCNRHET